MKGKSIKKLAILMAIVLIGAILAVSGTSLACHTKTVSCSPSTDQDITDYAPNNWVQYDITCSLSPGCSSHYYVAFTVGDITPGWSATLKNDAGQGVINPTAPSGPEITGYNWIDINSQSTYNVHLKVTAPSGVNNNDQTSIIVNCWSTDTAVNDLENDPVTTTTTVNIPDGIRMSHTHELLMSQQAYPGDTANFDLTIEDRGEASGNIDFSKDDTTYFEEAGGGDWTGWGTEGTDYSFSPNPAVLPQDGSTTTTLSATIPTTAKQGDKLVFVARGRAQANPTQYTHTATCFVNVIEHLPDLEVSNEDLITSIASPHEGDDIYVNITVENKGDMDVSNFDVEFSLTGEEFKVAPQIKTVTETLTKNGGNTLVSFLWAGADVEEGEHAVCIEVDKESETYPNGKILEMDENNNLAGVLVDVAAPRVKWIEGTIDVDPKTCNPSDTITVSGIAKYNADFGNTPVKNGDVTIEIEGTTISEITTTDNNGNYVKELTAPTECKKYKVTVDIVDSEQIGLKDGEKLEAIIEVRSLAVTINLDPAYCLAAESVLVSGKVKDPDYAVTGATVTIKIDGETGSWDATTDPDGVYSKTITAPTPTLKTDYTVTTTAVKGELKGSVSDTLTVDLDTDGDLVGNDLDEDDDGDGINDDIETQHGSDPLDETSKPDIDPVAAAGDDQTVYEGDTVNFDGSGSSDLYGSIVSFGWNFGDSSTDGTGDNPNHKYVDDGTYTVTLTVKDNDDNYASDTLTVTVLDKPPTAVLTCAKTSEEEDNNVEFDASDSTCISVDTIEKYEWDWDYDGEIFDASSGDSDPQATHKWSKTDEYTVAVRVTDDDDSTAIATYDIIITEAEDTGGLLGDGKGSDSGVAVLAIIVVVVIAIIIAVVFVFMKKGKKPPETKKDERVETTIPPKPPTQPTTKPTGQERDWNWDFRE